MSSATVDHRGEFLRLDVSDDQVVDEARRVLAELGYDATEADRSAVEGRQWHGQATVRELSREEAEIIAERVVKPFGRRRELAQATVDPLTVVVSAALYECFAAHPLGRDAAAGSLRKLCAEAARSAATPVIGEDAARDLASAIEADLSEVDRPS